MAGLTQIIGSGAQPDNKGGYNASLLLQDKEIVNKLIQGLSFYQPSKAGSNPKESLKNAKWGGVEPVQVEIFDFIEEISKDFSLNFETSFNMLNIYFSKKS